jgi:hypothetical protein
MQVAGKVKTPFLFRWVMGKKEGVPSYNRAHMYAQGFILQGGYDIVIPCNQSGTVFLLADPGFKQLPFTIEVRME